MAHQVLKTLNILLNKFQAVAQVTPSPSVQNLGILRGIGLLGGENDQKPLTSQHAAAGIFVDVLSAIIGVMTVIAFIWFIFVFLVGAISWLASGGDKTKIQNAQKQITNGLIGLVIVISAIFLFKLIGSLLGVDITTDLFGFIIDLGPK
jgi:hypothetical protein